MTTQNSTNHEGLTTNGQLIIGSTGSSAVVNTLTAGSSITITNGAGSITIASTGGGAGASVGSLYPIIIAQFSN